VAKDDKALIQSVDRALRLLEDIAEAPGTPRSLADLAAVLDIDRSSVFRLLTTLSRHGLVRQDEGEKGYRLGFGIYRLAGRLRAQEKMTDLANPYLKRLVRETGENAHLAVRAGLRCVFIDRESGPRTLTANTNIGDTEELYCTAVGKSLICRCSEAELDDLFAQMDLLPYTENTQTDPGRIREDLARIRDGAVAVDDEEYESGVFCLAVPLVNFEGTVEAALGLSGPAVRLRPRRRELEARLLDLGREIGRLLGGAGED